VNLTPPTLKHYHVFLASPADVNEERQVVRQFFDRYNQSIARLWGVRFEVVDWENYASIGVGRPQELITQQTLDRFKDSLALVIGLMGQRFGSPTGKVGSGTEEEFRWSLAHHQQNGSPEIKWFFKRIERFVAPPHTDAIMEAIDQWQKVQAFRQELTALPVYFAEYSDVSNFKETLENDLTRWLADHSRPWINNAPQQQTSSSSNLTVRRVLSPDDADLPEAYDLYCEGIDNENECDSFAEIQRWLAEAEEERLAGTAKLDEYLLIAKLGTRVCGFFYGQYYPSHQMFLVGYLVIDPQTLDSRRTTSIGIIEHLVCILKADHPECAGVVFEIALEPQKDPRVRTAKEKLFAVHARTAAKIVVKRLEVEYRQPKLSLWDPSLTEERQHLIYGRFSGPPLAGYVSKQEASHVLDAVYNCWYADYFLNDESKDAEYRRYVQGMYEDTVSSLPAQVPLI
jgi:hypothetical protein